MQRAVLLPLRDEANAPRKNNPGCPAGVFTLRRATDDGSYSEGKKKNTKTAPPDRIHCGPFPDTMTTRGGLIENQCALFGLRSRKGRERARRQPRQKSRSWRNESRNEVDTASGGLLTSTPTRRRRSKLVTKGELVRSVGGRPTLPNYTVYSLHPV